MLRIPKNTFKIGVLVLLLAGLTQLLGFIYTPALTGNPFVKRVEDGLTVMDFVTWYQAGAMAVSEDRFHVYDADVQQRWLNKVIAPETSSQPFYIVYPPFFFWIMAPFSLLSLKWAFIVWITAWPVAVLASLYFLLKRYAPQLSLLDRVLFLTGVLFSEPAGMGMNLGQTSWWLTTACCFYFHGIASGNKGLGGASLALASIKPQYVLFLGSPALVRKQWGLLMWAAIVELALLVVAAFNMGWQSVVNYPSWLAFVETSKAGHLVVAAGAMVNYRGLFSRFLPPQVIAVVVVILLLLSLAYIFRLWRAEVFRADSRWPMALTLMGATLASPHTHSYDLLLLSIAAAITLPTISISAAAKIGEWPLRFWTLLFIYYPILSWVCVLTNSATPLPMLPVLNITLLALGATYAESVIRAHTKNAEPVSA